MKIGIWLGFRMPTSIGGGASYSDRFLYEVDRYQFDKGIDICYISFMPQSDLKREIVNISQIPSFIYKIANFSKYITKCIRHLDYTIIKIRGLARVLKNSDVRIVFYYTQTTCIDSNFPFIANNWDIGHRSTYAFPELIASGRFEGRDEFYKQVLPKSLLTICESQTGKQELIDYTSIGAHKIRVMPIFAGGVVTMKVPEERIEELLTEIGVIRYSYFYYPAQFWAHKNHIGILKAFKKFCEKKKNYKLVFSGSDRGNKEYILSVIHEYGLDEYVVLLGFISDELLYTLYKNAACLLMASHFGPTNMPPIEAMELSTPVVCSDLGGHREILGKNGIYFNSYDSNSILKALIEISENRQVWVDKINIQKGITIFNVDNAMKCLNSILLESINIRENWGRDYDVSIA